ncbi:hypothetical protein BDN72DRAFT_546265 [Pluteus cervinus]|uniref:Uncharacterized protein n=1 Tax=Pluteus cervinus TaxID=181527 RepID=A0ACD3A3A0_9AGAR|nr:hypothetical protein BDN72DRAFT_546265 [Pluteus cervinus]
MSPRYVHLSSSDHTHLTSCPKNIADAYSRASSVSRPSPDEVRPLVDPFLRLYLTHLPQDKTPPPSIASATKRDEATKKRLATRRANDAKRAELKAKVKAAEEKKKADLVEAEAMRTLEVARKKEAAKKIEDAKKVEATKKKKEEAKRAAVTTTNSVANKAEGNEAKSAKTGRTAPKAPKPAAPKEDNTKASSKADTLVAVDTAASSDLPKTTGAGTAETPAPPNVKENPPSESRKKKAVAKARTVPTRSTKERAPPATHLAPIPTVATNEEVVPSPPAKPNGKMSVAGRAKRSRETDDNTPTTEEPAPAKRARRKPTAPDVVVSYAVRTRSQGT